MKPKKTQNYPLWIPAVLLLAIALVLGASALPWAIEEITYLLDPASRLLVTPANYPRIDTSASTQPVATLVFCRAAKVACTWEKNPQGQHFLKPDINEVPYTGFSGAHGAVENLVLKQADLILIPRAPSPDELAFASRSGVTLESRPIALDALVFIINAQNPLPSLAADQIKAIYTGQITNWSAVGLTDGVLHPYSRDRNSGSLELMETLVLQGAPPASMPKIIDGSAVTNDQIATDPYALSYSVYYYEARIAQNAQVRTVAVNGLYPDASTIRTRQYPFVTEVYAVIRADQDRESSAYHLYDWLLSSAGQKLIEEAGYVPVQ